MGNLTSYAESLALDWLNGVGNPPRPTPPLMLRLMTANGDDDLPGIEVDGGGYDPQPLPVPLGDDDGSTATTVLIDFPGMPACAVVGAEVWDSAGVPKRLWVGALEDPVPVAAGQTFRFPAGDVVLSMD